MKKLLKLYENKKPEIIFEWSDSLSEAKGWVVINSLKGGAAGGGTRMRKGLNKHEVISLAKTMEIKFTVAGPSIGGAKSGINFDPNDPRKKDVLRRWFQAIKPLLKNYYGTGGDLNIDEINELGFYEMMESDNWFFVEWPELLYDLIDFPYTKIKIKNVDDIKRIVTLTYNEL